MKRLVVLLLPLDGILAHRRVYTPGWKEVLRGQRRKCLQKELDLETSARNHEATAPPTMDDHELR